METEIRGNWTSLGVAPKTVYEYVFYYPMAGELDYLYVGDFEEAVNGATRHLSMRDKAQNWVSFLPEACNQGYQPMYNMMALSLNHRVSARIIIFQTEKEVDALEGFFRESQDQYLGICFLDRSNRQPDLSQFKGRDVVLWPHKTEEGEVWASRMDGGLRKYAKSVKFIDQSAFGNGSNFLSVLESSPIDVMVSIESAGGETLTKPVVRLVNGFSSLTGFIPPRFIESIQAKFGDQKTGKIDAEYETILEICSMDPAFDNFVKLDRATGQMCFSPVYHDSYDEADNAILNRLTKYGVARAKKDLRYDIIKTLSLKDGAVFNSVIDHFNRLLVAYPNPKNRLQEIIDRIKFEENDSQHRGLYSEMFGIFFARSANHVVRAFSDNPIPNDLVPVIVGGQGVGKSRFARYLSMDKSLFQDLGDKGVTLGSADCIRHIAGKLIVELSEMSVYTRTEIGTAKAFISQTVDEFRQLFERGMTKVPRSSNMIGTTNEARFLRDMTGNRRFFPVRVVEIDHLYLFEHKEIIEETWAHYYKEAKYKPEVWYELSQPIKEFFFEENAIAMDIGFNSDIAEQAIHNIEPIIYAKRVMNSKAKSMYITTVSVGLEIQRMGGNLPGNINKVILYNLKKLGYEEKAVKDNGRTIRAMSIDLDNPALLERVAPAGRAPLF